MSIDPRTESPHDGLTAQPPRTNTTAKPRNHKTRSRLEILAELQVEGRPTTRLSLPPCTQVLIGRGSTSAAPSSLSQRLILNVPYISRLHAMIDFTHHRGQAVAVLRDCNSNSGLYLGEHRIFEVALHTGMVVGLDRDGRAKLAFRSIEIVETDSAELWPNNMYGRMIGESPARLEQFQRADSIARAEHVRLIVVQGGRGVGKKQTILEIAEHRKQTMTLVNCSALSLVPGPRNTKLENERPLAALLEQYKDHVLYIERVEDLSSARQEELLQILRARRDAASSDRTMLVFSFRQELAALLDDDTFHGQLYAELARAEVLTVPSLAECGPEEVAFLAKEFHQRTQSRGATTGCTAKNSQSELSAKAIELLQREAWPENVRQLQEVLNRSCVRVAAERREAPVLGPEDLQMHARLEDRVLRVLSLPWHFRDKGAQVELCRIYMEQLLIEQGGVILKAAARANMGPGPFRKLLQRIGLHLGGDEGLELTSFGPVITTYRQSALTAPKTITKKVRSRT